LAEFQQAFGLFVAAPTTVIPIGYNNEIINCNNEIINCLQLEALKEFGERLLSENHFDSKNIKKQLDHVVKRYFTSTLV